LPATQAIAWYRKAAEKGIPQAQYNLAEIYEKVFHDYQQAILWDRRAAEQDFQPAQSSLERLSPIDAAEVQRIRTCKMPKLARSP